MRKTLFSHRPPAGGFIADLWAAIPASSRGLAVARVVACALLFGGLNALGALVDTTDAGVSVAQPGVGTKLIAGARLAIDDSEKDLQQMPFFVRPFANRSFARRTGLSRDEWRERFDRLRPDDVPDLVRARWPDAEAELARLAEDFRGAPERAKKRMPDNAEAIRSITESSKVRAAAIQAMLTWLKN